jgi:hypothetical protein
MISPRLHLCIPSAKPWFLPIVVHFFTVQMEPHPFELRLHLAFQGHEPDPWGQNKTNEILEGIKESSDNWLFMFADDSLHHPSLFSRLGAIIASTPDCQAVVFGQKREGHVLHASPDNMKRCFVDGGQFAWRRDFLGPDRYLAGTPGGQADGILAEHMWAKRDRSKFMFWDEPLVYFNSLEWKK